MTHERMLMILRDPYGYSVSDQVSARIHAADFIEDVLTQSLEFGEETKLPPWPQTAG